MNLDEVIFTIFDFETTGLSPLLGDEIVEIGAIKVCEGEIISSYHSLINPGRDIPPEVTAINKITNEMVVNAPSLLEKLPEFLDFIDENVLVAHNAPFDYSFLVNAVNKLGFKKLNNYVVDTLVLSRKLYSFLSHHNLEYLKEYHNIYSTTIHRAIEDSIITFKLLMILFGKLKEKSITTLKELKNFQELDFNYMWSSRETPTLVDNNLYQLLTEAMNKQGEVIIEYKNSAGIITKRVVTPYRFVYQKGAYYFSGFCQLKGEERTFKLNRILSINSPEEK